MTAVRQRVLDGAPDPEDALRRWERIAEAARGEGLALGELSGPALEVARLACQRAPYLAALLARDPSRLGRVAGDAYLRREKPAAVISEELAAQIGALAPGEGGELQRRLRRYRADEICRTGVRELAFGTPAEVGRELAHLADACFQGALEFHRAELIARHGEPRFKNADGELEPAEFVVIGMGKLGGEELNFSSDVDVIYVYSSDAGEAGELTLHEFFAKLAERVTQALGALTDDELVFRVDLRLRPEGSRGAIANSLLSLERYYETWGRPWERQAWIKARPCAGSKALGEEVLLTLRPFVYPRSISPRIIDDVRDLNRRIKAELAPGGIDSGFDLKNGVGGIREIEFFVQALQLVHAGHLPALRVRATRLALDQLLFAGIISEAERSALAEAYRFLRHAEHVIQLESGRQTQRLPVEPEANERLARRLGCIDRADFERQLARHTTAVSALFATLGAEEEGPPAEVFALLGQELEQAREEELLARLGFRDPPQAAHQLAIARRRPDSPLGRAPSGAAARVAPALLAEIAASPDPDQALGYLCELSGRRGSWSAVWRLMDENPPLLRLVASLFGASAYLARQFVNHPELIDGLLLAGRAEATTSLPELGAALDARLAQIEGGDDEAWWDALAEAKNAHVLRIGLADIGGMLSPRAVSDELSKLAEVCLDRAFRFVQGALLARHGQPRDGSGREVALAVLAMGKLGGRELGYASDLDVVFVYDADGETDGERKLDNVTFMSRLAQRMMGGLHSMHRAGRLYEVDTRLRPSGSHGLLVSTLAAWERYHREHARLWERQALTKLRPVAGDAGLGQKAAAQAEEHVFGMAPGEGGRESVAEIARAVHEMRERIERELGGSVRGFDVKLSRGGLIDIEFAAQYLQLAYGHDHRALRTGSTALALERAAELELAPPAACALLAEAYDFMRRLEHRMRVVHDRSVQRLPEEEAELTKLARRANFPDGTSLRNAYTHWTTEVRKAYRAVLGLPAE